MKIVNCVVVRLSLNCYLAFFRFEGNSKSRHYNYIAESAIYFSFVEKTNKSQNKEPISRKRTEINNKFTVTMPAKPILGELYKLSNSQRTNLDVIYRVSDFIPGLL